VKKKNLKRPEEEGGVKEMHQPMNAIRKDVQNALRKRQYPFKCELKRNKFDKQDNKQHEEEQQQQDDQKEEKATTEEHELNEEKVERNFLLPTRRPE